MNVLDDILPDAESVRRKELIFIQKELQSIWDKIEFKLWFASQSKKNEKDIERLWNQFENFEVVERELLRTGTMIIRCSSCGLEVWDSRNFINGIPFCKDCCL